MTLAAILCNPPTAGGERTRRRVEMASRILGEESLVIVNLFPVPSRSCLDIAQLGHDVAPWLEAREEIQAALSKSSSVLLAYGLQEPTGPARLHYRAQVAWLRAAISAEDHLALTVGSGPSHPSRWQRVTSRTHPGVPFGDALASLLVGAPGAACGVVAQPRWRARPLK